LAERRAQQTDLAQPLRCACACARSV